MNIVDYIKKYGNTDYETEPFNNVDRLILSQMSYLKFDGLVPFAFEKDEKAVSIAEISKMANAENLFLDERYAKQNRTFFGLLADNRRFSEIKLNYYVNIRDIEWEIQFSAITAFLPTGQIHVIFRGTDESIIGWKEDLNMAFMTPIPAQEKAVEYVRFVASKISGEFSVGGHSKGGNLAVYSAMMSPKDIQDRITRIESHDGPGFSKQVLKDADFDSVKGRIHKFVPQSSVVGMLLETVEDYEVVSCKNVSIFQHDPYNWLVNGNDFSKKDSVRKHKLFEDESINKWANSLSPEELKELSDSMFEVFSSAGIDDLNDINGNTAQAIRKIIEVVDDFPTERKDKIKGIMECLVKCASEDARAEIEDRIAEIKGQLSGLKSDAKKLILQPKSAGNEIDKQ